VAAWVADRDGGRAVALGPRLERVRAVALHHPVRVAARADGGAWVVEARAGSPVGPHALTRLAEDGRAATPPLSLGPVLDLACLDGEDALAVELASGSVVRVDAAGSARTITTVSGATAVTGRAERALVGADDGRLVLFDAGPVPALLAVRDVGGEIGDVRPGPTAETWWALDVAGGQVLLVDDDLDPIWTRSAGVAALHVAPVAREERVWLIDANEPHALRYGPTGALELSVADLPLGGLDRGAATGDGGLLLIAPGAVLRLDGDGRLVDSQGGFDFLTDLSRRP
jgi:hypothetical protein